MPSLTVGTRCFLSTHPISSILSHPTHSIALQGSIYLIVTQFTYPKPTLQDGLQHTLYYRLTRLSLSITPSSCPSTLPDLYLYHNPSIPSSYRMAGPHIFIRPSPSYCVTLLWLAKQKKPSHTSTLCIVLQGAP